MPGLPSSDRDSDSDGSGEVAGRRDDVSRAGPPPALRQPLNSSPAGGRPGCVLVSVHGDRYGSGSRADLLLTWWLVNYQQLCQYALDAV